MLTSENILAYRNELKELLTHIAFGGFPPWNSLERVDANPSKLQNDARKLAFIEAIGQFNVPVLLPYGNPDTRHQGEAKSVNLLSLSSHALVSHRPGRRR